MISLKDYKKRIQTSPRDTSLQNGVTAHQRAVTDTSRQRPMQHAPPTLTSDTPYYKRILYSRYIRADVWDYVRECQMRNQDEGRIQSKGFSFVEGTSKTFNQELEEDAVFDNPYSIYHMERAYNISPKEFLFQRRPLSESSYYEVLRRTQNVQYAQHQLGEAQRYMATPNGTDKALEKLNNSLDFYPECLEARFLRAQLSNTKQKWKVVYDDSHYLTDRRVALERGEIPAGMRPEEAFTDKQYLQEIAKEVKSMLDRSRNKLPPDERRPPAPGSAKKKKKNKRKRDVRDDDRRRGNAEDDRRYGKRSRASIDRDDYGRDRYREDDYRRADSSRGHRRNDDRYGGRDHYGRGERSHSVGSRDSRDYGGDSRSGSRHYSGRRDDRRPYREDRNGSDAGANSGDELLRDSSRGGERAGSAQRDNRASSRDYSRGRDRSPYGGGNSRSESVGRGGGNRPESDRGRHASPNRDRGTNRDGRQPPHQQNRGSGDHQERHHGGAQNRNPAQRPGNAPRDQRQNASQNRSRTDNSIRMIQRSPSVGETPKLAGRPPVQGVAPAPTSERRESRETPKPSPKAPPARPQSSGVSSSTSTATTRAAPRSRTPTKASAADTPVEGVRRRIRRKQRIQEEEQKQAEVERKKEERIKSNPIFGLPSFKKNKNGDATSASGVQNTTANK